MKKKILIGAIALSIAISLTACGGSSSAMSKKDYEKAVSQISIDIYTLSNNVSSMDSQDIEQAKKTLEDSKKSFSDFLSVTPPKEYAEAHEKIKAGCQAIVDIIDKSSQALDTSDDAQKKQIEEQINQSLENALDNLIDGSVLMDK